MNKFRAWDIEKNEWCQNLENFLMINPVVNPSKTGKFLLQDVSGTGHDRLIIQRFTGRNGQDGKEIYEGDIVLVKGTKRIGEYKAVVEWKGYCWVLTPNKTYFNDPMSLIAIIRSISNICEEPF